MGMLGAGIDAQVLHLLPAEGVARDHALHRLDHDALRMVAFEDLAHRALFDAARMAGVPVELLVGELLAGQLHLLGVDRSEEHTSELQSLMRISYAVFCLKKKI